MNSYTANSYADLPVGQSAEVVREAVKAISNGELICVRMKIFEDGNASVTSIHRNTEDFIDNYRQNGGMWSYTSPWCFITDYIDFGELTLKEGYNFTCEGCIFFEKKEFHNTCKAPQELLDENKGCLVANLIWVLKD